MAWRAAVASVAGSSHLKTQTPCQDFGAFAARNGMFFGAVSDGAGSASRSDLGSRLAVATALAWLKTFSAWPTDAPSVESMRAAFTDLLTVLVEALEDCATKEHCELKELSCTLLAVVAAPGWTVAAQIGDGLLVARPEDGEFELLFKPDKGEYLNETTFVTSETAQDSLQVCVETRPLAFLCAATDGIERVAIRFNDWTPHSPFFKPLEDYLITLPDSEQGAKDIAEFLDREKLAARCDDDRTLLICRPDPSAPAIVSTSRLSAVLIPAPVSASAPKQTPQPAPASAPKPTPAPKPKPVPLPAPKSARTPTPAHAPETEAETETPAQP